MAVVAPPERATCFKGFSVLMDPNGVAFKRNFSPKGPRGKPPLKPVRVVPLRYSRSSAAVWNALHSANSPYGHQEIPTTASPLTNSSQLDAVRAISDDLQNLERKLERERDRRTNVETLGVAKFETKVLGDENMEAYKRNGFRPSARGTFFTRDHASANSSTLTNLNNDNLLAMGALAITTPPSASSRKQQLLSKDIRTQPSHMRSRGTMTLPLGRERAKQAKYVYADAVSGGTLAFQQRISELASLENDTLRYERTRKLKKKTKQERD